MSLLIGTVPVYAVIQDRGFQNNVPVTSNDDVLTSIANMDKTLSALNTKLPSLIESRFKYYESLQRQNQVKQVIAQLGAFLIALMVYALIRNKNDRDTERVLTRSEQILTNIETRIKDLEDSDEVNVNVVDSNKSINTKDSGHLESKDNSIINKINESKNKDITSIEKKDTTKPIIHSGAKQKNLKTITDSKSKKLIVKNKDNFLGIDKL